MKDIFANRLRELRRERGMGQEQLASICGVSVQAVSKWECAQSYPDIELLEVIAGTFDTTIDALLREDFKHTVDAGADAGSVEDRLLAAISEKFGVPKEDIGRVDINMSTGGADGAFEPTLEFAADDGVLRVAQFIGNRILDVREAGENGMIPLLVDGIDNAVGEIKIEILGDASLALSNNRTGSFSIAASGDIALTGAHINGPVTAGGGVTVSGGSINGPANVGGDVNVKEGDVNGPVNAGGNVDCCEVAGGVSAGGNVGCGEVAGGVSAGGNVDCGEVGCDVNAGGDVSCGDIGGDVSAGCGVSCGDVGGDVRADGGDVSCGDVGGDVSAGGGVSCGDVGGDVMRTARFGSGRGNGNGSGSGSGKKNKGKSGADVGVDVDVDIDMDSSDMADIFDFSDLGKKISSRVNSAIEAALSRIDKFVNAYDDDGAYDDDDADDDDDDDDAGDEIDDADDESGDE